MIYIAAPHFLDWSLMVLQILAEFYYITSGIIKSTSFLMILLKFLLIWDLILYLVVICHDIPSYFMAEPLSTLYPFLRHICTFVYFMHFFFALFSLGVFSFMTYAALQWPTNYSIWIKRRSFTYAIIGLISIVSFIVTVPMFFGIFQFSYNKNIKHWHYDTESAPLTVYYRMVSMTLQGIIMTFFAICVLLIGINYFELKRKFFGDFRSSSGRAVNIKKLKDSNIYLFVMCFLVLGICFTIGTISWNAITCSSMSCQIFAVLGNFLDRGKWIFYCIAFHFQKIIYSRRNRIYSMEYVATISQAVKN